MWRTVFLSLDTEMMRTFSFEELLITHNRRCDNICVHIHIIYKHVCKSLQHQRNVRSRTRLKRRKKKLCHTIIILLHFLSLSLLRQRSFCQVGSNDQGDMYVWHVCVYAHTHSGRPQSSLCLFLFLSAAVGTSINYNFIPWNSRQMWNNIRLLKIAYLYLYLVMGYILWWRLNVWRSTTRFTDYCTIRCEWHRDWSWSNSTVFHSIIYLIVRDKKKKNTELAI